VSVISMTGFGRGEVRRRGVKIAVELSSVNRRRFDCHLVLPQELATLEAKLHALIQAGVRRGDVKGVVQVTGADGARSGGLQIDLPRATAQVKALRRAARHLGLADDLSAGLLLKLPGVLRPAAPADDPLDLWPPLRTATLRALAGLQAMRAREGAALARDLARRFGRLRALLERLAHRAAAVPAASRLRLARRLKQAGLGGEIDPAVLARELAIHADRSDVSEELTRLSSHLGQAERLMAGKAPAGRALDFLCQEIMREINTIAAKSGDAAITRLAVAFKTQLEAAREQIQNVE
jgi:uncharacterized protein (TIGR00255 family)